MCRAHNDSCMPLLGTAGISCPSEHQLCCCQLDMPLRNHLPMNPALQAHFLGQDALDIELSACLNLRCNVILDQDLLYSCCKSQRPCLIQLHPQSCRFKVMGTLLCLGEDGDAACRKTWRSRAIIWGWQGSTWPVSCRAAAATTATAVQAARPAVKREARLLGPLHPGLRRRPMHGPHIKSDALYDLVVSTADR